MNNLECTTLTFGNMQWYVSGQVGVGTKCIIKQRIDSWKCTKNEIELVQQKTSRQKETASYVEETLITKLSSLVIYH